MNQTYLRNALFYDANTGEFTWINPPKNHSRLLGRIAGRRDRWRGYVIIKLQGRAYKAHRLAWLYVHGFLPPEIDHADGDRSNNRLSNLRTATNPQNQANRSTNKGKALPKGVRKVRNRYNARISYQRRLIHLGMFQTPQEASEAYFQASRIYYGEFARA